MERVPSPSRTRPSRDGQPKRREQEVIEVAAKVFYERGYANASIQDIANELGILKGSLYHYIRTKEDLLFRLLEALHEESDAMLEEIAGRDDLGPLERIAEYVRRQVDFNARNLERITVYYHDLEELSGARTAAIVERRRAHERFVEREIQEARAQGQIASPLDAATLRNFIFGPITWMYRWYRPGGTVSREELAEQCATFVLYGLAGRQRPSVAS